MTFDQVKTHEGQAYSGMRVGGAHDWSYPDGRWRERKMDPDRWTFTFQAMKRRRVPAPDDSGAEPGSAYDWLVIARQTARKVDANAYRTLMRGLKFKVGHKRPHWKEFSYEYPDQRPQHAQAQAFLEEVVRDLRVGQLPEIALRADDPHELEAGSP